MKNIYEDFTNLYKVSKTLRFELKPQGKTLENMKQNGVIQNDEFKAECYKKVKKLIDEYHKDFITRSLTGYEIDEDLLEKYYLMKKDKNRDLKELKKIESDLRKDISDTFTKNPEYKKIHSDDMISKILPEIYKDTENMKEIEAFSRFSSYFSEFHVNRKNIYSGDEKSTAIAYRLINDNLPIFMSNMELFKKIKENLPEESLNEINKFAKELITVNSLDDIFELKFFNKVLIQEGIDAYNQIIGGLSKEDGSRIRGINEYVNEFRQKNPDKAKKVTKLDFLYKQILSDKETASFVIETIEDDKALLDMIANLYKDLNTKVFKADENLESLLKDINTYNLDKIYVKTDSLTSISKYLFGDWRVIPDLIKADYDRVFGIPTTKKQEKEKDKYIKNLKYLSLQYINECLQKDGKDINIEQYFKEASVKNESGEKCNVFRKVEQTAQTIDGLLSKQCSEDMKLKSSEKDIEVIKDYLDSVKEVHALVKELIGVKFENDFDKDDMFYERLNNYWEELQNIISVYNKTRNYLTGKPYSTNKIKLNFSNPTLLNGWALSNEIANSCMMFRKDGKYYLGIINNNYNKYFKTYDKPHDENDVIEKMEYLQIASPNKDLPNLMVIDGKTQMKKGRKDPDGGNSQLEEAKEKYLPHDINEIRKRKSYLTSSTSFSKNDLTKFIDYYKDRVCEYYNKFPFEFKESSEYKDFNEFTDHVNEQAYIVSFVDISNSSLMQLVDEGKLYLFQIYNKDFSEKSHGKDNLHTMYWKALFSEENLKDVVYKLDGNAEMFYRKASIERKITHPKNQKIKNRNSHSKEEYRELVYDLIKDKRFTEDKFQLHVPISLNFKEDSKNNKINEKVNKAIKGNEENYVIGIDRGERNLLYMVLIDSKGNIITQESLNIISNQHDGKNYKTDYYSILDNREKEREKARKSWQTIENIKDFKQGYLSQAINKITDLMIEYNAIVVLEDLNPRFMQGRQKVEKQVYQKFEKMLIDKLNYLVKKDKKNDEPGGILKAYQLTNKFESFNKLGKQSGFLYYVPATFTSKIDPVTGFVNFFYIKYESEEKAKEFVEKIDDIRYNSEKNYFEFDIDYLKFPTKVEETRNKWTLCTYGKRIKTFRNPNNDNRWTNEEIDLTDEFKKLLEEYDINLASGNLKRDILEIKGKAFWERFIHLFKLMVQMRNSFSGTDIDYIISPVMDKDGKFFDSREQCEQLPKDADANGAYNIARKGLMLINQIKNTPDDKLKNIKFAISKKEWFQYVQGENEK